MSSVIGSSTRLSGGAVGGEAWVIQDEHCKSNARLSNPSVDAAHALRPFWINRKAKCGHPASILMHPDCPNFQVSVLSADPIGNPHLVCRVDGNKL